MAHKSDSQLQRETRNTPRFFVEQRHIAWVLLAGTVLWGIFGYISMPKRKDPYDPVRDVMVIGRWPGMPVEKVEQFVTKKIERTVAQNPEVEEVRSITRPGESVTFVRIKELSGLGNRNFAANAERQYDDIKIRLDGIHDFPAGVLPVEFYKDFADTATLMLTVASPAVGDVELGVRARDLQQALKDARAGSQSRASLVLCFPMTMNPAELQRDLMLLENQWLEHAFAAAPQVIVKSGFAALDVTTAHSDSEIISSFNQFAEDQLEEHQLDPEVWKPIVIRDVAMARERLAAAAQDKYTYHELDTFTELIERNLKLLPQVAKVTRYGLLPDQIDLAFSQERLASYGVSFADLRNALSARNIALPGGSLDASGRTIQISPTGEFHNINDLENVIVSAAPNHPPLYLRDLVEIHRGYQTPPQYLNHYQVKDANGLWRRSRAITLDVQMAPNLQIAEFGQAVDKRLAEIKPLLPPDLVLAATSDQPQQVHEQVNLFMTSLWEAVGLVVLVAFIGFREWRSALLLAISIPLTLAMTFGMMYLLGIDIQQLSITTLIVALGLLVDDPVVAGDAIQREVASGHPPTIAAWLGPTKLARAIFFATLTNIVAYLPFMLLPGDQGMYLYAMPVVITCSLIASRVVSMTFIPLIASYLIKSRGYFETSRRQSGFMEWYTKLGAWAIDHRWRVLAGFMGFLVLGGLLATQLKQQFFPKDLLNICYVDVWLPENASFAATENATRHAEDVIERTADEYAREHLRGGSKDVLKSLTTFVGGSGPRYWFTLNPEPRSLNYAHILIQTADKNVTRFLAPVLQRALSSEVSGARIDVQELEVGPPVGVPVALRLSGEDIPTLRAYGDKLKQILRDVPVARRVRDDWGTDALDLRLQTSSDRANLAGVSNEDVAVSALTGFSGLQLATLREDDKSIPIVARLHLDERSHPEDLNNLYIYTQKDSQRVPLPAVASVGYESHPAVIHRINQFRTITVGAYPAEGVLASEVLGAAMPKLHEFEKDLPPGFHLEIAGENKEEVKANGRQARVLTISVAAIFLALVIQLRHAAKPLIVFSAVPFGIMGAFAALYVMNSPFGFMAFLGATSLIGVIVSHIIVLFDFIEERREQGGSFRQAVIDAGVLRLRPVLITAGATVMAFFPLAVHGGPLWEPLCFTQIGGLTLSTIITLVLVPAVYAIFVEDLKWVAWQQGKPHATLQTAYPMPTPVSTQSAPLAVGLPRT